jgi:amino acid transporter
MIRIVIEWIKQHLFIVYVVGGISLILFITSMIAVPFIIINLPEDFLQEEKRKERVMKIHFVLRLLILILKNIIGFILIVAGILMIVLPGPGIITILIGVILFDFPGKHKIIFLILRNPLVLGAINWIRKKNRREPLRVHDKDGGDN